MTTPLEQYEIFKQKYPKYVLVFRAGDFCELYGEDARLAHELLGLALTVRGVTALTGFPRASLDCYLVKLIRAGHRVAICEHVDYEHNSAMLVTPGAA